jgi:hemolysin III
MSRAPTIMIDSPAWHRSADDERINAITHAIGMVLAVVGALVMSSAAVGRADTWLDIGCGVYLASLMAVYTMSTLSHGTWPLRWKLLFRRLDQACIYLLIAATYTPFSLAYLRDVFWWTLLAAIWAVAIAGFIAKLFFAHRVDSISLTSYIVLGWMPMIAAPSLMRILPLGAFWWMVGGGACYTIGTLFLTFDQRVRHFHAVWHLCVIAGSVCHFVGILVFVVGGA